MIQALTDVLRGLFINEMFLDGWQKQTSVNERQERITNHAKQWILLLHWSGVN